MNKTTTISILIAILFIGGAVFWAKIDPPKDGPAEAANNVSIVDGQQIVEIKAKGGYMPRVSQAKAGVPTVLRIDTKGTFDCSSVVLISKLNIQQNLPPSGTTDIDLGAQKAGTLQGSCGMGMYPFEIVFR